MCLYPFLVHFFSPPLHHSSTSCPLPGLLSLFTAPLACPRSRVACRSVSLLGTSDWRLVLSAAEGRSGKKQRACRSDREMKGEEKDGGGRAEVNVRRRIPGCNGAAGSKSDGDESAEKNIAGAGESCLRCWLHPQPHRLNARQTLPRRHPGAIGVVRQGRHAGIGRLARRRPICHRCCHFMTGDEAGAGEAKRGAKTGSSPGRLAAAATPRTEA